MGIIAICCESRDHGRSCFVRRNLNGEGEMKNIDIRKLPELETKVGIHGSARQQEVGGVYCAGVVIVVSSG